MIQLKNINLSFGDQKIFDNISLITSDNEKSGLVGLNGSGKSTLLKVIAGEHALDSGTITRSGGKKIGYMPQEVTISSQKSALDETVNAVEIFDETETESIKAEAKKILMGLGFSTEQLEMRVCDLSVGWRMRIILAQLLLQKADFYLFDEPTNHLDIVTKEWFLQFLKRAKFGFLLVCHEKYFLDQLCNKIYELELGQCTVYAGNYSSYCVQKEERKDAIQKAYVQQQKEITRKQATIDRFKAGTKATFAKSMQKMLDKTEKIVIGPEAKKLENFRLPTIQPSGRTVVTIRNLERKFGERTVFKNVSFSVERHEKIAIIAANGVGKTTLLNIIAGKLKPTSGSVEMGYNVTPAFFEQDQVRALNPEDTIFETLQYGTKATDLEIRTMLGNFLFSQDLIHKKTKVLSGGERNRVSMARVLLQNANFLMLDEPTNHLDIPSKEILLHALQKYTGTILFVSHDQDFINKLATHIIELTPEGAYKYMGNYEEFLDQKNHILQEQQEPLNNNDALIKPENKKNNYELNKELRRLEQQIDKSEKEANRLSIELANYEWGTKEYTDLYSKVIELQKKQAQLLELWETLQHS